MATELVWYEVVDLTSYGVKYPTDWYVRCGHQPKCWENSVCESLGKYSSKEKALSRLKKWTDEKGIDFEKNNVTKEFCSYYEDSLSIECRDVCVVGLYYDYNHKPVSFDDFSHRAYMTGAAVVRKSMTLDEG